MKNLLDQCFTWDGSYVLVQDAGFYAFCGFCKDCCGYARFTGDTITSSVESDNTFKQFNVHACIVYCLYVYNCTTYINNANVQKPKPYSGKKKSYDADYAAAAAAADDDDNGYNYADTSVFTDDYVDAAASVVFVTDADDSAANIRSKSAFFVSI